MFTVYRIIRKQFLIKAMKHLLWKLTNDFLSQHINRILEQIASMCALEHLV